MIRGALGLNNYVSGQIAKNKDLAAAILADITTIGPTYSIFYIDQESSRSITHKIQQLARERDIVIKASDLSLSQGMYIKPQTAREISRAVRELTADKRIKKILVEPYFTSTSEYRIHVYKGTIIDVLLRTPAHVDGDGHTTISDLVAHKNTARREHHFKTIQIDSATIAAQSMSPQSIPQPGERVWLQQACNLALGGEVERLPKSHLHKHYTHIAKELYERTQLVYVGLDLMTTDPKARPTKRTAFINEFNSSPNPDAPYFAGVMHNKGLHGVMDILAVIQADLTV